MAMGLLTFVYSLQSLTDEMLFEVSVRLDDKTDIRRLGLKLNVQNHIINAALSGDTDLSNAAQVILKAWFKRQNCRESAYQLLRQALRDAQLNMIIHDAL